MKSYRSAIVILATVVLAACGGSSGQFDERGDPSMTVTAEDSEVTTNPAEFTPDPSKEYTTQVSVRFHDADNEPVDDGTSVELSSSSEARGVVSPANSPNSTGSSATASTSGGVARFFFTGNEQPGGVTVTASAANPDAAGNVTATVQLTVVESDDQQGRVTITGDSSMPANTEGVPIFLGSPFMNELTIRYRGPDGEAGQVVDGEIAVAIAPVDLAAYTTLDDPETEDINEFLTLMGSGPVFMNAGTASVFVHSFDQPGTVTFSATVQDLDTEEFFSGEFDIVIEEGAADFLPNRLEYSIPPTPLYIQGSGGTTSKQMSLFVDDSGNNPVPDPEGHGTEYNNVHLELEAPDGSGARLSGTGAGGTNAQGTEIDIRTVNGIANFALNAGSETGSHRIIATVDRSDNNVDNDIADPLSAETTVEVGDGRLFSLRLVTPIQEAILTNMATNFIETDLQPQFDPETGQPVPPGPDGTYTLLVTAFGSDRVGNPVLGGTTVNFGKFDAPLRTSGNRLEFAFRDSDGNPEEGGELFTAPGASFSSGVSGEFVEPGDTLALFGKEVSGGREHEVARFVDGVVDNNTLTVERAFNDNDGTGSVVDHASIPWILGRSDVGVIDQSISLDSEGRGTVRLTYPISQLGRPLVVWAQGERPEEGASRPTQSVADVAEAVFPGIAPLTLNARPNSVPGNTTTTIELCVADAMAAPITNARIGGSIVFDSSDDGSLFGRLDGRPMPTETLDTTGSDGCVETTLQVGGMEPDSSDAEVLFFLGGAEVLVTVVAPGEATLSVVPAQRNHSTDEALEEQLTLTLRDGNGNGIGGVVLEGECQVESGGTLEITRQPDPTNASGATTADVLIDLASTDENEVPRKGTCTFTDPAGEYNVEGLFTAWGYLIE